MQTLCSELSQKMHITPQMAQALTILSLSGVELDQLITKELEENPLLDYDDQSFADASEISIAQLENQWQTGQNRGQNTDNSLFLLVQPQNLTDYLEHQLSLVTSCPLEWRCGRYIIASLDDSGYLTLSMDDIVLASGVSSSIVETTINLIQNLDPIGFACRNLTEYLLIQLSSKSPDTITLLARKIISYHIEELAERKYTSIAKQTNSSFEEVFQATKVIQQLNPRPINAWRQTCSEQYIVPDLIIDKIGDTFITFLNPIFCRSLRINSQYRQLVSPIDVESRRYIDQHQKSASWLIHCIKKRENTIRRVAEAIMRHQEDFLKEGSHRIKPLNLKHIANQLNLHESTVSRAIMGKYIQTPQGTYALKDFFPSGFITNGKDISCNQVQKRIAEILKTHSGQNKISDRLIVEILQQEGIRIARRTVTKYRNQLGLKAAQPHH